MKNFYLKSFSFGIAVIFLTSFLAYLSWNQPEKGGSQSNFYPKLKQRQTPSQVKIGETLVNVEVATTPTELRKGLSGRKTLGANDGMLFILGQSRKVSFWMKDMLFSIDIIWIKNEVVVGFVENAPLPSETEIPSFDSPGEVTSVLEVNAGFVKNHSVSIGQKVVEISSK